MARETLDLMCGDIELSPEGYGMLCDSDGRAVEAHEECDCGHCGRAGYRSDWPGEGQTDDEHPVIVCAGLPDGTHTDECYCEDCVEEYEAGEWE